MKDINKTLKLISPNNSSCNKQPSFLTKDTSPKINIIENNNFYDIFISLNGLKKEEILLNYINNFFIIIFSIHSSHRELKKYKRSFYLKSIDINNVENIISANLVHLKVPKIIDYN